MDPDDPRPDRRRHPITVRRRAIDAIVNDQIAHLRALPTDDPLDVLGSLVVDGELSDGEIRDQVVTLMGAGYDTTSASLSWMFWRVSQTDHLWARLRAEADDVLGPTIEEGAHGPEALAALDLADRTMRETTRLHPAGVVSPREAAVDVIVGEYRIPKGTLILWSAHLAGRDERAWADPLRFEDDGAVVVELGSHPPVPYNPVDAFAACAGQLSELGTPAGVATAEQFDLVSVEELGFGELVQRLQEPVSGSVAGRPGQDH